MATTYYSVSHLPMSVVGGGGREGERKRERERERERGERGNEGGRERENNVGDRYIYFLETSTWTLLNSGAHLREWQPTMLSIL